MCIGIPMQVLTIEPGHALCQGRGEQRRVNTALLGSVSAGDWLLIFLDSAQERLSAERALEINATLDLMAAALQGQDSFEAVAFALPSAMSQAQILALSGAPDTNTLETSIEH
jgi:hydrogenase expression/formation protein HypC